MTILHHINYFQEKQVINSTSQLWACCERAVFQYELNMHYMSV